VGLLGFRTLEKLDSDCRPRIANFKARFFRVLKPLDTSLDRVILAFGVHNHVIIGVSVHDEAFLMLPDEYEQQAEKDLERAKTLLHEIAQTFGATHGFVAWEEPPPLEGIGPEITPLYSWPKT
jgi:hypothetical protein